MFVCAAGLLKDSAYYPGDEFEEVENKLKGLIDALASAETAKSDQNREDGLIIDSLTYVQYIFAMPDENSINQDMADML